MMNNTNLYDDGSLINWSTIKSTRWKYARAFLPHKCKVTGNWLWLGKHYMVITKTTVCFGEFETDTVEWIRKDEGVQMLLAAS
jgi:hypothetical protein